MTVDYYAAPVPAASHGTFETPDLTGKWQNRADLRLQLQWP